MTLDLASAGSSGGLPTDSSCGARRDPSLGTGGDAEDGSTTTLDRASRQYWHAVLDSGGFTAIPRWTLHPVPGIGTHDVTVSGDLAASLHGVADELGLPLGSVVFAAHAKVLAALSGETSVSLGYVPTEGGPAAALSGDDGDSLVDDAAVEHPSSRDRTRGQLGVSDRRSAEASWDLSTRSSRTCSIRAVAAWTSPRRRCSPSTSHKTTASSS